MSFYKTCPHCGANLDPGERCDCQDKEETAPGATNTGSGRVEKVKASQISTPSIPKTKEDCKMKATKKQIITMDQIMNAVVQTDEWFDIQENDPGIKRADEAYHQVLDKLRPLITHELEDELGTAVAGLLSAQETPAILYGLSVAETIRAASANPTAVSKRMLERTGRLTG